VSQWSVLRCCLDPLQSKTIRDFDDRFTAPVFGYDGYESYYHDACIDGKVHDVKVPLLCLNAADDPFSPGDCKYCFLNVCFVH